MSELNEFTFANATLKATYQDAVALRGEDTSTKLPEIIHAKGYSMEKAVEISNRILTGINSFDRHLAEITEGRKVVNEKFARLDLRDQLTLARNIRVIRAAMDDENVQKELQNGVTLDRLSDELFGDAEGMTDEEIRAFVDETLEKTDELGLTEHAANRMLRAIKKNRKVLSTMRSIAVKDYDLKACAALEIYLSTDETVSVEDAVSMACSSVELQRVADDLDRGIITAKVAQGIILAIGLAASLYMLNIVLASGTIAVAAPQIGIMMFLLSLLALMGIMSSSEILSEKIPLWVGWLSVKAPVVGRQVVDESVRIGEKVADTGHKVVDAFTGLKSRKKVENTVDDVSYTQENTLEDDEMNEVETNLG